MTSRSGQAGKRLGVALSALAVLAASIPQIALAQDDGPSLIRDTEIEEILHHDADPIYAAAGLDPRTVRILIVGDKSLVSLVAHELAHSWSGNLVTFATDKDSWLNEGTTT